jgi:3',5'-cyclic AMP phosphodiesterase CpdA
MRVVHIADIHLQPERNAPEQFDRALEAVQKLDPDAILLGGDIVMNTVSVGLDRALQQWQLWSEARKKIDAPIYPCVGNQDCWGWNLKASGCTGEEPLFGKKMALSQLGMDRPYYAADLANWRLIVLDSVHQGGRHGFVAELDRTQFEWLTEQLESSRGRPVVIMSHIPIVAGPADLFSSHINGPNETGVWPLPAQHLHRDSHEIVELLRRFPNVKLCLAGHIHARQRIEYGGIWFIHSPAICGEWWRGDFLGAPPGFSILDLYEDGSFRLEFSEY